jgi:hypothetical protein
VKVTNRLYLRSECTNCGRTLTFEVSASLGRASWIHNETGSEGCYGDDWEGRIADPTDVTLEWESDLVRAWETQL